MSNMVFSIICFVLNTLCIFTMIFIERKKPERVIAWMIILVLFPFVGFFFYLMFGAGIGIKTKRMLKQKTFFNEDYNQYINKEYNALKEYDINNLDAQSKKYKEVILLNMKNAKSLYSINNSVDILIDGDNFFNSLKRDILDAKESIDMMFYIFAKDKIGKEILDILIQKAKEGVKVRLLFDSIGSLTTRKRAFKELIKAGGEVAEFFPPLFGLKLFNLKANYRNHRKIVVIDKKIGYTGGLNVRDDHMGLKKNLAPWRDTGVRIVGEAVVGLEGTFLSDWRFAIKDTKSLDSYGIVEGMKDLHLDNTEPCGIQILSSGPDSARQEIKTSFIKMILNAQKSVKIQTPYFVPDEAFVNALKMILMSGVEVELMIPKKPDKFYVYDVTLSYAQEMMKFSDNFKVYLYDGFIHAKTLIVDDEICSIGSSNIDNRSFNLNFETNALIINEKVSKELSSIFDVDKKNILNLSLEYFNQFGFFRRVRMSICKIFSPLF